MGLCPEKGFYCTHCSNYFTFVLREAIKIVLRPEELSIQVAKGKTPWVQLGCSEGCSSTEDPASLQSFFLRLDSLPRVGKTCRLLLEGTCMAFPLPGWKWNFLVSAYSLPRSSPTPGSRLAGEIL